jgi:glycerol-3-phosphate dehydrogenase
VLTVAGGKLTTLRSMAEQAVDRAAEMLRDRGREGEIGPCVTAVRPLPGGGPTPAALDGYELAPDVRRRLSNAYGARAARVLGIAADAPDLARRIDPELPYLWAEVVHAARHEHALDVRDALVRRVPLHRDARDQGLTAAPRAAALMANELGWTPAEQQRAVDDYTAAVAVSRRWRQDPA